MYDVRYGEVEKQALVIVELFQPRAQASGPDRADGIGVHHGRRAAAAEDVGLVAVEPHHAGVEEDVGVDDLAGERIDRAVGEHDRPDEESGVG